MRKVLSILLSILIVASIIFGCSLSTSAIAGVDDAVVIGVCLDLLALGVSIHGVSNFCKSQAFNDFCRDVGQHVDSGISAVKRAGKLFIATTRLAWQDLTNWVKSKIHPGETQTIEFEAESVPTTLTLKDGRTVPYMGWMEHPFFIFGTDTIYAYYCTNDTAGARFLRTSTQICCQGTGQVGCYRLNSGASDWTFVLLNNMTTGHVYKGVPGSIYNVNYSSSALMDDESKLLYRTIERITNTQDGTVDTTAPPASTVPEQETSIPVTVTSDENLYPGAVNSPAEVIQDDELIMIEVPSELIVEAGTANETVTSDRNLIGNVVSQLVPSDVNPRVLTNANAAGAVVGGVIADTPEAVIPQEDVNNPDLDIETANKFRLPKSFLEGFPFSIPYSVYVGIQSFVSDPVAPTFSIPFSIPRLGIDESMEIDLNQFSPLARLCRALLSLVWVAGLAMACSKFIKR